MKFKKISCVLLAAALAGSTILTGCGATSSTQSTGSTPSGDSTGTSGEKEVLEFYHGYFHDESEWAPAKAMRDIYDEFAKQHADGPVEFKAIPTEDIDGIIENKVAGGSYPDMIDLAGRTVSLSAIAQGLVLDMKPYIDAEGLQDNVGINYTQNNVDGKIYTVHDQLLTLGYWYNEQVLTQAGASLPDTWKTWDDFEDAMQKVRAHGGDIYAYGSGQGSTRCLNAILGMTPEGQKMINAPLSADTINSKEFEEAFKQVAAMDQANGSANASSSSKDGANDWAADFNKGNSAVFFNGVWAAGGFEDTTNFKPAVFPGSVALSSASGGLTIAENMSDAKKELALEFIKYMTSDEVQTKIFTLVGANPCSTTLDLNKLAEGADEKTVLLAQACAQANSAENVVPTLDAKWGTDIATAIGNKLIESTVSGTDIDAKFEELKSELLGLIG